jgi:cytochrome P450
VGLGDRWHGFSVLCNPPALHVWRTSRTPDRPAALSGLPHRPGRRARRAAPPGARTKAVRTHCLGANLARLEIELTFNAIADTMPGIRQAGDPVRLRSGWINGLKRLPVSYTR